MATLAVILVIALALYVLHLRSRISDIEQRLDRMREPEPVWRESVGASEIQPEAEPEPQPGREVPPPLPGYIPPLPPAQIIDPGPTLANRLRAMPGDEEWETLVGGSLLNKLGALVLVVGIALFLGFSLTHMSAAGRTSIALAVSVAILRTGVWVERRDRYRVFARGLIGAGWAALYATAYAAYALPESRIIENPFVGSVGVLLVAVGVIGHSLRYRAQAVTGVAYFAAFAALAATPSSPFAVISLIPLAASLLWLAARFGWYSMAVFGAVATYLTCVSRGNSNAPLVETQSLFLAYWLLFDLFDLLRTKRRTIAGGVEWIWPINVLGFTGLSYLSWNRHAPDQLWIAAAAGAALFLADAIARAMLQPGEGDLASRLRTGSCEGPALVSAVLAGMAIVSRVPGVWTSAWLALEAEIVYLAGVRFHSRFLMRLSYVGFAHSLARVFFQMPLEKSEVLGHTIYSWTPPALFHAVLFYFNGALRRRSRTMSSVAALLVSAVLFAEMPFRSVGAAWIVFGAALLEIGIRKARLEFRAQGYTLLAVGAAAAITEGEWPALAISLAVLYGCAARSARLDIPERQQFAYGSSASAVLLAAALLWRLMPLEYLSLAWFGLALLVLETGRLSLPRELKDLYAPAGLLALAGLAATHASDFAKFPARAVSLSFFGASVMTCAGAVRTRENPIISRVSASAGLALGLIAIWLVTPDPSLAAAWIVLPLILLDAGQRFGLREAIVQSYAVAGLAFVAALMFDIDPPRLFVSLITVAGLYASPMLSIPGSLLLCAVLYGEVSGGLLTVSWGFEGLALLATGFILRHRMLRLQGLGLLLICILKLFLYDLRNLEILYRILSFVALGLILLGVSWIYTRFRDHLRKLL